MELTTDKIASTHLGKKSQGSNTYNPSLLVAVPREENRLIYGIKNQDLPFYGSDVWHAYEFSALTENGIPVTKLIKLKYNCENEYLIESKSLKLYLNSFNMTRIGKNSAECLDECKKLIEKDLSAKLKTDVTLNYINNDAERVEIFSEYKDLMSFVTEDDLKIEHFKESPEVLQISNETEQQYFLKFDSLRSNCRVTHQPDFGEVFIYYKSQKHIDEASLIKYLVSFRSEYHFHEECCEMIYKRLYDLLNENDELMVCALYTRRGGIDICPVRISKNCKIKDAEILIDIKQYARCGVKQ